MDSYSDQDGTLHEEIAAMKDPDLDVFYSRLNSTLEHYQKYPALASEEVGDIQLSKSVDFSGEEVFGKYFDLNSVHLQISNICRKYGIDMSDYVHYLEKVDQFFYLPSELRQSKPYIDYLENLWHYLCDFMERVHPLISVDELEKKYGDEFHSRSTAEMLPGANDECAKNNVTNPQPIRLGMFSDVTELEALGMERLKEGLEALGLKCGGTIQDRANRLWLVRGMKPENYPSNLLAKKNKKRKADGGNTAASSSWKDSVSSDKYITFHFIVFPHYPNTLITLFD